MANYCSSDDELPALRVLVREHYPAKSTSRSQNNMVSTSSAPVAQISNRTSASPSVCTARKYKRNNFTSSGDTLVKHPPNECSDEGSLAYEYVDLSTQVENKTQILMLDKKPKSKATDRVRTKDVADRPERLAPICSLTSKQHPITAEEPNSFPTDKKDNDDDDEDDIFEDCLESLSISDDLSIHIPQVQNDSELPSSSKPRQSSELQPAMQQLPLSTTVTVVPEINSTRLPSPKKLARIPKTISRPSLDTFWNQDAVSEWNDLHSPSKPKPPVLPHSKPNLKPTDNDRNARAYKKSEKKRFEENKHMIAESFLRELDDTITNGRLKELTASTGGIKFDWTNKLNTTAGRACWKRQKVSQKQDENPEPELTVYHHHATIELAVKVIDEEDRLLNVIAHEFCHLAVFMISGTEKSPHGKEFKQWGAKCASEFGHRGIKVTTCHSYNIDFKYIWECQECLTKVKRHSKSLDPQRSRCGYCRGALKQIKPVPRLNVKPSKYQEFVKEQMKVVRSETPHSPQKDVMKIIAKRWALENQKHTDMIEKDDIDLSNEVDELPDSGLADRLARFRF